VRWNERSSRRRGGRAAPSPSPSQPTTQSARVPSRLHASWACSSWDCMRRRARLLMGRHGAGRLGVGAGARGKSARGKGDMAPSRSSLSPTSFSRPAPPLRHRGLIKKRALILTPSSEYSLFALSLYNHPVVSHTAGRRVCLPIWPARGVCVLASPNKRASGRRGASSPQMPARTPV
jgi:hypothetical protein